MTVLYDIPIDPLRTDDLLDAVFDGIASGRGGWVVTVNLDILRQTAVDRHARALYGAADVRVADGMPLVWASRLRGDPVPERVTGSGSSWLLAERAAAEGRSLYLLGGAPGAAARARDVLVERYPGLHVCGLSSPRVTCPPTAPELDRIADDVAACRPDLLVAGMGSPKQEHVIRDLRRRFPAMWFVGVGASIGFVAGFERRAPVWMQRAGLEWLHRLGREPRRLARRYLVDDLPFAARLLATAVRGRIQGAWVDTPEDVYAAAPRGEDRPVRTSTPIAAGYDRPALRREGPVRLLRDEVTSGRPAVLDPRPRWR